MPGDWSDDQSLLSPSEQYQPDPIRGAILRLMKLLVKISQSNISLTRIAKRSSG
jgi:hypothetical protein